jgi:UDP:flavonoid glycosyltransferase YjiC (YdhE family)
VFVKIVFAAIPAYGHLYPLMPLALACADAGHQVTVATAPPFLDRLPLPTILQQPVELELDGVFAEAERRNPGLHGAELVVGVFADVTSEAVTAVLMPKLEESRPDLVIYEAMNVGAGVAAHVLGIPSVAYSIALTQLGFAFIHPAAVDYRRDLWTSRGLPPPEGSPLLSQALLDPTPPSLQRLTNPLDVRKIPIRPVPYAETLGLLPDWLVAPRTRPRVYLTLGTVSFGAVEVLSRAMHEIADLDVDLLVAVGPEGDPSALGEVPGNVRLERFVDQSRVLPQVDLIVHHGGTGTVLGALAAGLPQLIMPQGADQFFNVEFLTKAGAARALRNEEQAPGTIRAAVAGLLHPDAAERAVARQIQAEIADLPEPAAVIPELLRVGGG